MIQNYIELGKITDSVFFKVPVTEEYIILIYLSLDFKNKFSINKVEVSKNKKDKYLSLYIKPTKLLTQGSNRHLVLADFKLTSSYFKANSDDQTFTISNKIFDQQFETLREKLNRNFGNTKDYYENFTLQDEIRAFIESFYYFLLENNSEFIIDVWKKAKERLKDFSVTEIINDCIFSFKLSKSIIKKFNLDVKDETKKFFSLSQLSLFKKVYASLNADKNLKNVNKKNAKCSFCNTDSSDLYSPNRSGFYFTFTGGKENNYFGLNSSRPDRHLIICDDCYANLKSGERFVKDHLKGNFMGVKYYMTFNISFRKLSPETIEAIEEDKIQKVYTQEEMERKLDSMKEIRQELFYQGLIAKDQNVSVNIFFGYDDNGFRLIKLINDIYPIRIVNLFKESQKYSNFSIGAFLIELFNPSRTSSKKYDFFVKRRVNFLEEILLKHPINYDDIISLAIKKLSYYLRNKESNKDYKTGNFTIRFLKLIYLLLDMNCNLYSNNIDLSNLKNNKVNNMEKFESKEISDDVEKLEDFVEKNNFIGKNPEIEAGMYLGILIKRLGYDINNYEKTILGYAEKRINDIETLKRFINQIQNKIILHKMGNQKMYKAFSSKILPIFNKDEFSKNDFIFGMFLGYSLSHRFKKDKNKEKNQQNKEV